MPEIRVIDEFDQIVATQSFPAGANFFDVAHGKWPNGWPGKTVLIRDKNGELLTATDALYKPCEEDDSFTIHLYPQGPAVVAFLATPFLGATIGMWAIAAVSLAASFLLAPKVPDVGGNSNYEWDDDRPQFFSGQSNRMRPGTRVPEIFGRIRTWPDLITAPYVVYQGQEQLLRELYVVSNGYCEVDQVRLHDEDVLTLPDGSFTVYHPGQSWPTEFPIIRANAYVGGIELPGPNEGLAFGAVVDISGNTMVADIDDFFEGFGVGTGEWFTLTGNVDQNNQLPNKVVSVSSDGRTLTCAYTFPVNESITDGTITWRPITELLTTTLDETGATGDPDVITLSDNTVNQKDDPTDGSTYTSYTGQGGFDQPSVGKWTFVKVANPSKMKERWRWNVVPQHSLDDSSRRNNRIGDYAHIDDGDMLEGNGDYWVVRFGDNGTHNPDLPGTENATPVYRVPGTVTEILTDYEFPNGLYKQSAGETPKSRTVTVRMHYRLADSSDPWVPVDYTFTAKARTPRRYTRIETVASGEYEVYFERMTNAPTDTGTKVYADSVQLIGLHGRQDVSELANDTLNVTLVELNLTTQDLRQLTQERSFNVVATRFLPDHVNSDPATLTNRVNIQDAILYTLIDQANYDRNNIDIASLSAIQADLETIDLKAGQFHAIIDQTMTAEDQISSICSVGRIIPYRRASTIYFNRLKAGNLPVTLINGRNKVQPETKTMTFSEENEPDVIFLRYLDQDKDWKEETIQWPTNVVAPINPQEQSILGVTDAKTAERLAQYAWERKIYEKDIVSITVTDEAILLAPGDVIAVTDHLEESPPIDGEILGFTGTDFVFDQLIPEGTYMSRIRDKYGDLLHQVQVTIASPGANQPIPEWAGAIMPDDPASVGLLYSFSVVGEEHKEEYYVTSVTPSREGPVNVTATAYRDEAYACDQNVTGQTMKPKKRLIINGQPIGA